MKLIEIIIPVMLLVSLSRNAVAQHNHSGMEPGSGRNTAVNMNQHSTMPMLPPKMETLKVWGKCEMCKARIEKIALANGALNAEWNIKTKLLTVVYEPDRSSIDYISGKLARAGHDTGLKRAREKAYNALPDCCKYQRPE